MRALLNLVGVGIDRSELCCVLFGSVLTSKVTQAFVPQGRTRGKQPATDRNEIGGYLSKLKCY